MIDPDRFRQRSEALSEMLQARLGVRGKGLEVRLARAGRRLPRALRREARAISQAGRLIGHPRLARLVDPLRTERAFDSLAAHLKTIDRVEARRNALLTALATIVFNLLLFAGGMVAFLTWRGVI